MASDASIMATKPRVSTIPKASPILPPLSVAHNGRGGGSTGFQRCRRVLCALTANSAALLQRLVDQHHQFFTAYPKAFPGVALRGHRASRTQARSAFQPEITAASLHKLLY